MSQSVQSVFEFSIYLPLNFFSQTSREQIKIIRGKKFRQINGKFKTQLERFLEHLLLQILSEKFMKFSELKFYENYLTSVSHANTVISRGVCLPIKMASETVTSLFLGGVGEGGKLRPISLRRKRSRKSKAQKLKPEQKKTKKKKRQQQQQQKQTSSYSLVSSLTFNIRFERLLRLEAFSGRGSLKDIFFHGFSYLPLANIVVLL